MAKRLQSIFGTEEDKVNCPFYFKIGACRHGDTCTRVHNKPPLSQTMCFKAMYQNPNAAIAFADGRNVPEEDLVEAIEHFEAFYEEIFMEFAKFGEIDELVVADNIGDHMIGNVYIKYQNEEQAEAAMKGMNGRYYSGRMIMAEYSPVTDFREAKCRQYKEGTCERGGFCNFMHPKPLNRELKKQLFKWMYEEFPKYREDRRRRREEEDLNGVPAKESPPAERRPERESKRRSRSRSNEGRSHHRDDRRDRDKDRARRDDDHHRDRGRSERDRGRSDRDRGRSDKDRGRDDRSRRDGDDDYDRKKRERRDRSPRRSHRSKSRDRDTPTSKPNVGGQESGRQMMRMSSEERRAMIAGWADVADESNKNKTEVPPQNPVPEQPNHKPNQHQEFPSNVQENVKEGNNPEKPPTRFQKSSHEEQKKEALNQTIE